MRFGKRLVWVAATITTVCLLSASCGKREKKDETQGDVTTAVVEPARGGIVYRHLESDCRTLNWVLYGTTSENYVLRYLYDHLLDYDQNAEIVPVLAESYEINKDNRSIRVTLRDSLRWHDGAPITAEDVRFTVDIIRDPLIPAVNKKAWFTALDYVQVVDSLTVDFVWKVPYVTSLHALAELAPIPKHIYGVGDFNTHAANREPVGSGPFRFEEWRTGQMISIVRNDDYYGPKPYVDRVIFKIIPEGSSALVALRTGELDEMRVTQDQWNVLANDPEFLRRFDMKHFYVPGYNYFTWNCRSAWFSDKRVRRAMTMLFDRETLIRELYSGNARIVTGPFDVDSWAYDKSIEPVPFDVEGAKKLLDEAGWTDGDNDGVREKDGTKFEFDFYIISGSDTGRRLSELLQENCRKAGIIVQIRQLEGAIFHERIRKGEYNGAALAWRLENDPDIYDTFHSAQVPPLGLNHAFYSNSKVDSLLEIGRLEYDREKRKAIYHEVHRLIHEDQPYTFVNSVPEKRPFNRRIGNILISPDGAFDFHPGAAYWYVKDEAAQAAN